MSSRKRARSESLLERCTPSPPLKRCKRALSHPPLPRLSLTLANLAQLQQAFDAPTAATAVLMTEASSRASSPTRTSNAFNERQKLDAFRVRVDREDQLPPDLAAFVEDHILRSRNVDAAVSPNAKQVVARRKFAADQIERMGIKYLAPYLLFTGEAEMPVATVGEPYIVAKDEVLLSRFFAPSPPDDRVSRIWQKLAQPKPDTCIGYVTRRDAESSGCEAPLTAEEEKILDSYCLTHRLYFPFLTSQWKSPGATETLYVAQNQAAGDGATIVNYLHDYYTTAYGHAPSAVGTCHFSLTCDLSFGEIWVHWREGMQHHMEQVYNFSLRRENVDSVIRARGILKNVLDHAVNKRLRDIKAAIPSFETNRDGKFPSVSRSAPASESNLSLPSAQGGLKWTPCLTPASSLSEPSKKRARMVDDNL